MTDKYPHPFSPDSLKHSQDLMTDWIQGLPSALVKDMQRGWFKAWADLGVQYASDPMGWTERVLQYQKQQAGIWFDAFAGVPTAASGNGSQRPTDRRFKGAQWHDNPLFDYIHQSYLLSSEALYDAARSTSLSDADKEKLLFYTRQYVDAFSPTNFLATNPEVIQQAIDTQGQSLVDGMRNLLGDLEKGHISMTDEGAFRLGENLATTEGQVVFENDLFQLIHYKPLTDTVAERPLVIIPPFINKYYILDLQPENSFVRYCVEQGNSVFILSWANPDEDKSDLCWDDYIERGVMTAFDVIKRIHGVEQLNAVAWCVGGTLLATTLAVMQARADKTVASATFFTTLLDFYEPGELGVFIDPVQVSEREEIVKKAGMLAGRDLALVFSMLRANDLIWSYVVNNYLKGKTPMPFDILYWNSDPTNLPANMYVSYVENMYLENRLVKPNALTFCGEAIDLSAIETPSYFLCAVEDHIAPWTATYKVRDLFAGPVEFVLGASGHIAGVINPPSKNKRHYWIDGDTQGESQAWLDSAKKVGGSWWPHWEAWLQAQGGRESIEAVGPGNGEFVPLEPAPGRYVKKRVS